MESWHRCHRVLRRSACYRSFSCRANYLGRSSATGYFDSGGFSLRPISADGSLSDQENREGLGRLSEKIWPSWLTLWAWSGPSSWCSGGQILKSSLKGALTVVEGIFAFAIFLCQSAACLWYPAWLAREGQLIIEPSIFRWCRCFSSANLCPSCSSCHTSATALPLSWLLNSEV